MGEKSIFLYCKDYIQKKMGKYYPVTISKILYRHMNGKKLDLKNPKYFNEKLQWLKFNFDSELIVKCADKYDMREYVKECGCEDILNDLYDVYYDVKEINLDNLPEKFVIKCTHGCGYNIICDDINKIDKNKIIFKINKWMNESYGLKEGEIHYRRMVPKIIIEKYLEETDNKGLIDYKVYCFNGEPHYILVCSDRDKDIKKQFYDLEWNKTNLRKDCKEFDIEKPKELNKLIEYAKMLSKPFPFVRVDFYIVNGKIVIGELTFTPAGCLSKEYTEEGQIILGNLINLPNNVAGAIYD